MTETVQALLATPTDIPSPAPTFTPTLNLILTSTPQPPLQAHTWEVEQVLVQVHPGCGDGCHQSFPLNLILYADGLFIRTFETGHFRYQMKGRKLKRQEMCRLLNTIDQAGFLEYDHLVYHDPTDGYPYTDIRVDAWKSNRADGQLWRRWIYEGIDWWKEACPDGYYNGCGPAPVILPALSDTYKLLDKYNPGG